MKKMFFILVLLAAAGVAGVVLWEKYGAPVPPETVQPLRGKIVQAVYATGEVESVEWAKISPQIAGKIEAVHVDEGDGVTQGQILAQIDDSVEYAKAAEYKTQLEYQEKEKKRIEELVKDDLTSTSRYDEVINAYDTAKAQLESQNKVIARMQIRSPLDGIVLERDIEPGETVAPHDVLFWVGQPDKLQIIADVDEEDIALIGKTQRVLIKADSFPDKVMEGRVAEITPRGDPVDRNFEVKISLATDTPLMIGMTVEVNIITKQENNALLLPAASVRDGQVWVIDGEKILPHNVRIGITGEENVQILEGVSEEDIVLAVSPQGDAK